jgi:hypothetical protein
MKTKLDSLSDEAISIQPGKYRHYKGGEYEVVGVGRDESTLEELVIYKALASGDLWVRPLASFTESVEVDGQSKPRFTPI